MPYAPVDLNTLELDAPQSGFAPVDINTIELDPPQVQTAPKEEGWESKAVRATMGAMDPFFSIAQMVPRGIGVFAKAGGLDNFSKKAFDLAGEQDKIVQGREKWYQEAKKKDGLEGFDGLRLLGNVASPASYLPTKAAGMLPVATTLGQKMAQGAGLGAFSAALSPVADTQKSFLENKLAQMGWGAGFGAAIPLAGEGIARVISPKVDPEVALLKGEGVRLTPGQIMGGRMQAAEDKLTSTPWIGGGIAKAKQRGIEDLNRAAAQRALEPIGESVPKDKLGYDLVEHVSNKLSDKYEEVVPKLTAQLDDEFTVAMSQLDDMVNELPENMQKQFRTIIENNVNKKISGNGTFTGESMKVAERVLGEKVRGYSRSADYDQQQLSDALRQAQANIREWAARQNPAEAETLRSINKGWANLKRIEAASAMRGAAKSEGVFTPAQLGSAVKSTGNKWAAARGKNLMQDLSTAAEKTMSTTPNSGTMDRAGIAALMGAGIKNVLASPLLPAAAVSNVAYSRPGVAALEALLTGRQGQGWQNAAEGVRKITSPSDLARLLLGVRPPVTP